MHNGFVSFSPRLNFTITCPKDETTFPAEDWAIPGAMTMATGICPKCGVTWWTDFPYGLGFLAPTFLNAKTGDAIRPYGPNWYAGRIQSAWAQRGEYECEIKVVSRRKMDNPVLVNCLFPIYGEVVDSVLRINQLKETGADPIVLVPSNLSWMVSDAAAEVWEVQMAAGYKNDDLAKWNLTLDRKIRALVAQLPACSIPRIHQPQYLGREEMEVATGRVPFVREKWYSALRSAPKVTFMWRTERLYPPCREGIPPLLSKLDARLPFLRPAVSAYRRWLTNKNLTAQRDAVVRIAEALRHYLTDLDFAVTGFGRDVPFPDFIRDLRSEDFSIEANRAIQDRACQSHVLIGVHGSSLMPASGLSGAVVELMPDEKLKDILSNMLTNTTDPFETLYLYRSLPSSTAPETVAKIALSVIINYPVFHYSYNRQYYRPSSQEEVDKIRGVLKEREESLSKYPLLRDASLLVP